MEALPTLAVAGFTTDPATIMIKLYEYFLASRYSQSNTFKGSVQSMDYILGEAKDDQTLSDMTKTALEAMYNSYFRTVEVTPNIISKDNSVTVTVSIVCVAYDGTTHSLDQLVAVADNKIANYSKLQGAYYE